MKKFYCQSCGTEVPLEEDRCPKCLSSFSSVMCPKCNYKGPANKFLNGCPRCGYLKEVNNSRKVDTKEKKSNFTLKIFLLLLSILLLLIIILINLF